MPAPASASTIGPGSPMSARCSGSAAFFPTSGGALPIHPPAGPPRPAAIPPSAAPPDRAVLDLAIVHIVLSYSAFKGTLMLDAGSNPSSWSLSLEKLAFIRKVDGFGPLLTFSGGVLV